jgi:transcriptional regulator with XRE-family HTH domain
VIILIGERLRKLREDKGMTQGFLAELLNVSRQSIGGYENNNVDPPIDILVKIADVFNVSLDYLLGRTEEKYNISLLDSDTREFIMKIYELVHDYNIKKK